MARLVAKKGGTRIPFDTIVNIYVENPDTGFSESRKYFRSESFLTLVLPSESYSGVKVQVGDYVFVTNMELTTRWFVDPNTIVRVFDGPLPSDEYWSFQAVHPGPARFYAEGGNSIEAPPFVLYNVQIIVE